MPKNVSLSPLAQLISIRTLRFDKLVPAITLFVMQTLGRRFVEPPPFDLGVIFNDSGDPSVPLVFILAPVPFLSSLPEGIITDGCGWGLGVWGQSTPSLPHPLQQQSGCHVMRGNQMTRLGPRSSHRGYALSHKSHQNTNPRL